MFGWAILDWKVLYCHRDEKSAEGPFRSGTAAKQNQNVHSLKVLVNQHKLIKSQDTDSDTYSNNYVEIMV